MRCDGPYSLKPLRPGVGYAFSIFRSAKLRKQMRPATALFCFAASPAPSRRKLVRFPGYAAACCTAAMTGGRLWNEPSFMIPSSRLWS